MEGSVEIEASSPKKKPLIPEMRTIPLSSVQRDIHEAVTFFNGGQTPDADAALYVMRRVLLAAMRDKLKKARK
jgi:hypothetical protein